MTEEPHATSIGPAWEQALEAWDDDEVHRKFIALAASLGELKAAGVLYREVRESDPDRAEVAQKRIEKLIALAVADLEVARTPPEAERLRTPVVILGYIIALGLIGFGLWLVVR